MLRICAFIMLLTGPVNTYAINYQECEYGDANGERWRLAYESIKKQASDGDPYYQFHMLEMLNSGRCLEYNKNDVHKYSVLLLNNRKPEAMRWWGYASLVAGRLLSSEEWAPRDYQLATNLLKYSFKYNSLYGEYKNARMAAYLIGKNYYHGIGVDINIINSYAWVNIAAGGGEEDIINSLNLIEKMLNKNELLVGQELSKLYMKLDESIFSDAGIELSSIIACGAVGGAIYELKKDGMTRGELIEKLLLPGKYERDKVIQAIDNIILGAEYIRDASEAELYYETLCFMSEIFD